MKNSTKLLVGAVALLVGWHIAVAMSAKASICGLFLLKPAVPGYAWVDTQHADSRFFWQNTGVQWQSGLEHPEFKAEATENEGVWNPMPGYRFIDKAQGLNTVWEAGLQHPDYMAWSDDVEGKWIPVTGYRFIYNGDTFVDSVWDPNKRYDDLKVVSLPQKDHYKPFLGYTFIEPGQSLKVIWTPGTVNTDNPRLIAGTKEGTWSINSNHVTSRTRSGGKNNNAAWFVGGVATGILLRSL